MAKKILVAGDIMLDVYLRGNEERKNPEANEPLVKINETTYSAGGAGNVCINIQNLHEQAVIISQIGDCHTGFRLQNILNKSGVDTSLLQVVEGLPTITKTRIYSNEKYLLRYDEEKYHSLPILEENSILKKVENRISEFNVFLISDYDKKFLSLNLTQGLIRLANKYKIPCIADPKNLLEKYSGVNILTPNILEAKKLAKTDDLSESIKILLQFSESVLLTKSEQGMTYYTRNSQSNWTAKAPLVNSVIGAGDLVTSSLAVCLSQGMNIIQSLNITNEKVGQTLGKVGTLSF